MKPVFPFFTYALAAFACSAAIAQELESTEQSLNQSGLCSALPDFDLLEIAEIVDVNIPIPPFFNLDLKARWDKDRHDVHQLNISNRRFRIDFTIGCEPSGSSEVIRYLPINADDVRFTDSASCDGRIGLDSQVETINCNVSGEIGSLIASYIDLGAYVASSLGPD